MNSDFHLFASYLSKERMGRQWVASSVISGQIMGSPTQSAVSREILKQETSRSSANKVKWHASLIKAPQLDWSESKLFG
jgi:hypothetical protein